MNLIAQSRMSSFLPKYGTKVKVHEYDTHFQEATGLSELQQQRLSVKHPL